MSTQCLGRFEQRQGCREHCNSKARAGQARPQGRSKRRRRRTLPRLGMPLGRGIRGAAAGTGPSRTRRRPLGEAGESTGFAGRLADRGSDAGARRRARRRRAGAGLILAGAACRPGSRPRRWVPHGRPDAGRAGRPDACRWCRKRRPGGRLGRHQRDRRDHDEITASPRPAPPPTSPLSRGRQIRRPGAASGGNRRSADRRRKRQ